MTIIAGVEEIEDGLAASKGLNKSRPRRLSPASPDVFSITAQKRH